jgi:hypothetical protein
VRENAVRELFGAIDEAIATTLRGRLDGEPDGDVRDAIAIALALYELEADDVMTRRDAAAATRPTRWPASSTRPLVRPCPG